MENSYYLIQARHPEMPTLFADFPLIGSESFVYPCIINSHMFWPNEERSNIALRDGKRAESN